jgi:hypothetical protein
MVARAVDEVIGIREALLAAGGQRLEGLDARWRAADGLVVTGRSPWRRVLGDRVLLEWAVPSKCGAKQQLVAWVNLLVHRVASDAVVGARVVGVDDARPSAPRVPTSGSRKRGGKDVTPGWFVAAPTRDEAEATLGRLIEVWRSARTRVLPLFRHLSPRLAEWSRGRAWDRDEALRAADGDYEKDLADTWSGAVFEGVELEELLGDGDGDGGDGVGEESALDLARAVWGPLFAGVEAAEAGGLAVAFGTVGA